MSTLGGIKHDLRSEILILLWRRDFSLHRFENMSDAVHKPRRFLLRWELRIIFSALYVSIFAEWDRGDPQKHCVVAEDHIHAVDALCCRSSHRSVNFSSLESEHVPRCVTSDTVRWTTNLRAATRQMRWRFRDKMRV